MTLPIFLAGQAQIASSRLRTNRLAEKSKDIHYSNSTSYQQLRTDAQSYVQKSEKPSGLMGIDEALYQAIVDQLPEGIKSPCDILMLLDASDTGGLDGTLEGDNLDQLSDELTFYGDLGSLVPHISLDSHYSKFRPATCDDLFTMIQNSKPLGSVDFFDGRIVGGTPIQRRRDLTAEFHLRQNTSGLVYSISAHRPPEYKEKHSPHGLSGIHLKAGPKDTYASVAHAIATEPKTKKFADFTEHFMSVFEAKLIEELKEYDKQYNHNNSGVMKPGNRFHIGIITLRALNNMPRP